VPANIGERVEVAVVFKDGPRPIKFKWKGRVYPVKEVTHAWRTGGNGRPETMHSAVTDGATLFELAFDRGGMKWTLESVE
jgi:hypothetical protein